MQSGVRGKREDASDGVAESFGIVLCNRCPVASTGRLALQLNVKLVAQATNAIVTRAAHVKIARADGVPKTEGRALPPSSAELALIDVDMLVGLVLGQPAVLGR